MQVYRSFNDSYDQKFRSKNRKKREKIQNHFRKIVGADEHISLPKLKDTVKKEFKQREDGSV